MELLKKLCEIHAPSCSEQLMSEFLLNFVAKNKSNWKVQPKIVVGEGFQDCILLVFGKPTTAIFAHLDSVGYTVGYE